ncbi:hypothetical protein SAMN05216249_10464 [Acetitomaculum ruminis DSM 5522]|uniref:Uncharacterized protein n=1 Tax=Acetitomaculum ruminis DSM 5522 TaxID=1120918 RepID=A0A1I0WIB1_9FIRM|nr:hypothetical protein [Acetitomaculum ruminis]SFA87743.1 hypothetical protein SAMN05216249_10464 [Acetitomaculum ruminis DSM 5522]
MQNKSKREILIDEYLSLLKKSNESSTEEEKQKYSDLAHEKHQEILMEQFGGDKNIGRFNTF